MLWAKMVLSSCVHPYPAMSNRLSAGLRQVPPALSDIQPHESPVLRAGSQCTSCSVPEEMLQARTLLPGHVHPRRAVSVHPSICPSIGPCLSSPYMNLVTSTHTNPQRCLTPLEMLQARTLLSIHIQPCPAVHLSICPSQRLQPVPTCPRCRPQARTGAARPGPWVLPGSQPAGAGCSRGRGWQR